MKKQVLAASFASVLAVASMGLGVFAADGKTIEYESTSNTADVAYTTTEGYIVSIPANFTLTGEGSTKTASGQVSASAVLLGGGKTLTVSTYATTGQLTLEGGTEGKSYIDYTIQVNSGDKQAATSHKAAADKITVFTMAAGETSHDAETINLEATDFTHVNLAGEHKDKLTFTVDVANAA